MKGNNMTSYNVANRLNVSNDFIVRKIDEWLGTKLFGEFKKVGDAYVMTPLGFACMKQMRWFFDLACEAFDREWVTEC